jgi:hypothetical protein
LSSNQYEETDVYRKIIVGYDGSDQAQDALVLGRTLAKNTRAIVLVVPRTAESSRADGRVAVTAGDAV